MNHHTTRVLAVAPSSKGFGYAVLEEPFKLVDWGVKSVSGNWKVQGVTKVNELVELYAPHLIALPDASGGNGRRSKRTQLVSDLVQFAKEKVLDLHLASPEDVNEFFFAGRSATKHQLAVLLSNHFPDELGTRIPPKREAWMSEDYRMVIFTAVGLALTVRWKQTGIPFESKAK